MKICLDKFEVRSVQSTRSALATGPSRLFTTADLTYNFATSSRQTIHQVLYDLTIHDHTTPPLDLYKPTQPTIMAIPMTPSRFGNSSSASTANYAASAPSMADSLPSADFGFDDLRQRMAAFTARFDDFIEKGRKRVLEERNAFRMSCAEIEGMCSPRRIRLHMGMWHGSVRKC